jgi:hypothetical protein
MDLALQRELFSEVLAELDTSPDLTNQILEVTLEDSEAGILIERYTYPAGWDRPPVGRTNCWSASASRSGRKSTLIGLCAAHRSSSKFATRLN